MPGVHVTVSGRGKQKLIDRRHTLYFNISYIDAGMVLTIDSETCSEKRKRTKKMELEEYIIKGFVKEEYIAGEIEIVCKSIELRKTC